MRLLLGVMVVSAASVLLASPAGAQGAKPLTKCAPDAVVAGTVCMDTYEASVWRVSDSTGANKGLVKKIRQGKVTVADLTKGGATQLGVASDDYAPCADSGQNCANDIYAVSVAGQTPSASMTWFQAQQACGNAGKRLPSNAEWQQAVAGTPEGAPCNVNSGLVSSTGTGGCVSSYGAFDMVGNLVEWVADWVPLSTTCVGWGAFSDDRQCFAGASTMANNGPGALRRGGGFAAGLGGAEAGPLWIDGIALPSSSSAAVGFRCAR